MKNIEKLRIGSFISSESLTEPDEIIMIDARDKKLPVASTVKEPYLFKKISEIQPFSISKRLLTRKMGFTETIEGTFTKTDETGLWTFVYEEGANGSIVTIIRYKLGTTGEWQKIVKHVTWAHEIQNLWSDFTNEDLY